MKNEKKANQSKASKAKAKSITKRDAEEMREMYRASIILADMLAAHVKYIGKMAKIPTEEVELITSAAQGIGCRAQGWLESACGKSKGEKTFDGLMDDFSARSHSIYNFMWDAIGAASHQDFCKSENRHV